ncbi:hypothetical protein U1701_00680 [Sphingomonas sp. PB2P19]|uniref:hypothetical protein n=1 Tax=Sphingomonas rhamnosi TaxID=3096156 RepID=UPI002FCC8D52
MFRALIGWMDRDWASRKYNPVFAFGQRIVWSIPFLVSIAVIGILDVLDFPRDSSASLMVIALGATGTFAVMLVSLYRWAVGYSRSDFQDRAATEHRARVAARQTFFRSWFKRNGN